LAGNRDLILFLNSHAGVQQSQTQLRPVLKPKRKIIISVHGIRTTGAWQKQIASVVSENGWIYYPMDYGYFTAVHFALPPVRKGKITWFCRQFD
jgi:hypothetical protein